jgi:hypothetical protein
MLFGSASRRNLTLAYPKLQVHRLSRHLYQHLHQQQQHLLLLHPARHLQVNRQEIAWTVYEY